MDFLGHGVISYSELALANKS